MASKDDKIVEEAKDRFKRCDEWEKDVRALFVDDLKFAYGDSDNNWQWDQQMVTNRTASKRPFLTINKVKRHCLQIVNDGKQNKPSIKVHAMGEGATAEAAKIFDGVCRHIEYQSNAQSAYDKASEFQVVGGIGYFRITTDYTHEGSFDQEIYIRPVRDPLSIFLDPDIKEADGSDARFGFVFHDMPRDQYKREYGDDAKVANNAPLGNSDEWDTENHIRIAEYYRVVEKKDELIAYTVPETGEQQIKKRSELEDSGVLPEMIKSIKDDPSTQARDVTTRRVEWIKIAGDKVIAKTDWPGKYIPICRVPAEEAIVDGRLHRAGHVRTMKDPQRMYNFMSSAMAENIALQPKAPFTAGARAVEGREGQWSTANTDNHSVLIYNDVSDDGEPLEAPQRVAPPPMAAALVQAQENAAQEMQMVSGQYDAQMGAQSNERTGVAIQQRQRQGDTATYHFIDGLALAIRFAGKQLIDLIPKVYDTPRVVRIMAEDGTEDQVQIDPNAKAALQQKQLLTGEVQQIFNPNVGNYDVEADVGPAFATRRQEQFNALIQLATQAPEQMAPYQDLLWQAADFPGADEMAERARQTPAVQAVTGGNPQIQGMEKQFGEAMQKIQGVLSKALEENTRLRLQLQNKADQKEINVAREDTARMKVVMDHLKDVKVHEKDLHEFAVDTIHDAHQSNLDQVQAANAAAIQQQMNPPNGGQQPNSPV